jgi:XTP/dITP diphosphohydrolase
MKIDTLILATSNMGKLREYQRMAPGSAISLALLPDFGKFPAFEETAPTFAENAVGKALHYSRFADGVVLADDSGIVVRALDGRPGVLSARYGGESATDTDRNRKLLGEMAGKTDREARFVCVTALAQQGRAIAIVSDFVSGTITEEIRGPAGFGYDPVFFVAELGRTFGESTAQEKDRLSHRGKAFRKILAAIGGENRASRDAAAT